MAFKLDMPMISVRRAISEDRLLSNLNGLTVCGYCGINTRGLVNSYKRRDGTRLSYYACQAKDLGRTCIGARMIPQMIIDERVVTNLIGTLERLDNLKQYWINSQSGSITARVHLPPKGRTDPRGHYKIKTT